MVNSNTAMAGNGWPAMLDCSDMIYPRSASILVTQAFEKPTLTVNNMNEALDNKVGGAGIMVAFESAAAWRRPGGGGKARIALTGDCGLGYRFLSCGCP